MTDQRGGPLSTYLPAPNPVGPGVPKPIERPSLSQMWQAGTDLSRADLPSAERDRLYDAYQPVLDELNQGRSWFRRYHNPGAGGANFETYLFDEGGNPVASAPSRETQEQHLWAAIDARRQVDPKAFPGLPKTQDEFHEQILSNAKARVGAAKDTISRNDSWAGTGAQIGAGIATSFRDPINIAAMPLGGVGRTVATRVITSALANMAVEAVEQPFVAEQRKKLGEELTGREAATNIAVAGLFGAGLQGAGEVAKPLLGGAIGRGKALAATAREKIGWSNMTPAERIATLSLEREADIAATSPFGPGRGTDAHIERIEATVRGMKAGDPPPVIAPTPPRFDGQTYSNRIGVAESGGRWDIGSSSSSAYGMYQITKGTWLRYAKTALGGLEGEAAWARRTNPAAQEAVFNAITRDNRAALARAGVPETYGNLYMLHFAGSGAGTKILKAAPDTAIERLLSEKAIAANPFLKGKTAGEVVSWAHAKMRDTPYEGPVLSRAGFDEHDAGDVEWRAAQAEVEAAERQMVEARAADADEAMPRARVDDDDVPFDLDDPRMARGAADRDPFADLPDDMRDATPTWVDGDEIDVPTTAVPLRSDGLLISHAMREDVASFGEPADLVRYVNRRSVHTAQLDATVRDAIALRPEWRDDVLGGLVATRGIPQGQIDDIRARYRRPEGALTIHEDGFGHEASGKMFTYREGDNAVHGVARLEDGALTLDVDGPGANSLGAGFVRRSLRALRKEFPEAESVGGFRTTGARERADDVSIGLRDPLPEPTPATITGFDTPDDVAAARAIDSMTHDLRMLVDEHPDYQVKIGDETQSLSSVLDDLNADEAAIAAARACL